MNPLNVAALNPIGNRTGNMRTDSLHFWSSLAACESIGLYVELLSEQNYRFRTCQSTGGLASSRMVLPFGRELFKNHWHLFFFFFKHIEIIWPSSAWIELVGRVSANAYEILPTHHSESPLSYDETFLSSAWSLPQWLYPPQEGRKTHWMAWWGWKWFILNENLWDVLCCSVGQHSPTPVRVQRPVNCMPWHTEALPGPCGFSFKIW